MIIIGCSPHMYWQGIEQLEILKQTVATVSAYCILQAFCLISIVSQILSPPSLVVVIVCCAGCVCVCVKANWAEERVEHWVTFHGSFAVVCRSSFTVRTVEWEEVVMSWCWALIGAWRGPQSCSLLLCLFLVFPLTFLFYNLSLLSGVARTFVCVSICACVCSCQRPVIKSHCT